MIQLKEGLIGKHNSQKWNPSISSFDKLSYGDAVVIKKLKWSPGEQDIYIYLPNEVATRFFKTVEWDIFLTYKYDYADYNFPLKYWNAYQFKDKYPYHKDNKAQIIKYITNIKEYDNMRNEEDVKKIFEKYHFLKK